MNIKTYQQQSQISKGNVNLLKKTRSFGGSNANPAENVRIAFNLNTDLSPLFNWNTKQVFIYLTAEYEGKELKQKSIDEKTENQVVFWDKIITDKKDAIINDERLKSKYSVWDIDHKFENKTAEIKLHYNIQPWVGPLIYGTLNTDSQFQFPAVKLT
ncbi:hypothetical protein B5S28_g310 [[Candida] boidinii]|uniref:Unnamed protein product n=1 Tax=Candida boidinii TaxID=5477 RepID=A0ACB5TL43_CANBO|nr:hypothetical protein B5S28_g310 [[Candida] boidinii]OWB59279.1 hypothetical protein B5S29_g134 [[Candida] boidinii]OWB70386.1 hypothetical protein B5S31_g63 [[Candida] boidinii]OWB76017.1 hypothetical protein B5S32_g164 [[Candida] boidinii]GME76116.1 unnamed protein product [[Candida] boidinii]